jgi:hypothetical protein
MTDTFAHAQKIDSGDHCVHIAAVADLLARNLCSRDRSGALPLIFMYRREDFHRAEILGELADLLREKNRVWKLISAPMGTRICLGVSHHPKSAVLMPHRRAGRTHSQSA